MVAKALAKKAKKTGNFQGSYSRGSRRPTLVSRTNHSTIPPQNSIQDIQGAAP